MDVLTKGHPVTIDFDVASGVTLLLDPKELTPPGISAGGGNDTTTLSNTRWRTKDPKALIEMLNGSFSAAYNPDCYETLVDPSNGPIGQNGLITVTFPNDDTLEFYGFLNTFTPNGMSDEAGQPMADCEIVPTLKDPSGDETAPNWTTA